MAESFEYAIRKDVRNNPIVREVDDAKQRDLWKTVAVAGLFVVILLFWAWPRFEMLRRGYRLEEMQTPAPVGGRNHAATPPRGRNPGVAEAHRDAGD